MKEPSDSDAGWNFPFTMTASGTAESVRKRDFAKRDAVIASVPRLVSQHSRRQPPHLSGMAPKVCSFTTFRGRYWADIRQRKRTEDARADAPAPRATRASSRLQGSNEPASASDKKAKNTVKSQGDGGVAVCGGGSVVHSM